MSARGCTSLSKDAPTNNATRLVTTMFFRVAMRWIRYMLSCRPTQSDYLLCRRLQGQVGTVVRHTEGQANSEIFKFDRAPARSGR